MKSRKEEGTVVVFRKWKDGDIIALFPEKPGNICGNTCSSFEHVGQHGGAQWIDVVMRTTLAKPEEYADLQEELEKNYGYNLLIRKRISYKMYQRMQATVRKILKGSDK